MLLHKRICRGSIASSTACVNEWVLTYRASSILWRFSKRVCKLLLLLLRLSVPVASCIYGRRSHIVVVTTIGEGVTELLLRRITIHHRLLESENVSVPTWSSLGWLSERIRICWGRWLNIIGSERVPTSAWSGRYVHFKRIVSTSTSASESLVRFYLHRVVPTVLLWMLLLNWIELEWITRSSCLLLNWCNSISHWGLWDIHFESKWICISYRS